MRYLNKCILFYDAEKLLLNDQYNLEYYRAIEEKELQSRND